MAGTNINFIITAFNTEVTMDLCASLTVSEVTMDASCIADLYVDVSCARSAFQFQTDASDVIDASGSDIKYFVNRQGFWGYDSSGSFAINVADAKVNIALNEAGKGTTYPTVPIMEISDMSKNMVCHDFTRYLALRLFGTAYGVDLFKNERDLLDDIRNKSQKVWATIDNELAKYDVVPHIYSTTHVEYDVSYSDQINSIGTYGPDNWRYYTNDDENITKKILDQMAFRNPARLATISNSSEIQPIPFIEGDTISLKLTISPATNQHLLTGRPDPFAGRTFKIRFILVDDYMSTHSGIVDSNNVEELARDPLEYSRYRLFTMPALPT